MSINLRSPFKHPNPLPLAHYSNKRQRTTRTRTRTTIIRSHFGNFISDFVSTFPSINTLAPALAITSSLGLYIYTSKDKNLINKKTDADNDIDDDDDAGEEWMLFTTPSLFTRFVLLRCPSLGLVGVDDLSERLLKDDRHFVRVGGSGSCDRNDVVVERLEYQRVCVNTDDGGVIALDMPVQLDLKGDDGLGTMLLLVPGSSEGSMDKDVRMFVFESLKRGCFPVVLNPRGCAGSPLTTPRMFTAADCDDVGRAVQFITKARPRTTIMGVGWGFGANMLTKYLTQIGYTTPLTAAICFDNPFDLSNGPKTFQQNPTEQKLLDGLKNILRANKQIFQGRNKGFEVEKALLAKSVYEFDSFISMISYGFQTIEDFYSSFSTRYAVRDIRVPVLFIQSESEIQPLFYGPHSKIAENPFTSLLLRSSLPSNLVDGTAWYHYVAIEWLAAVELGLLKDHHPFTKDTNSDLCLLGGRGFSEWGKAKLIDDGKNNFSDDFFMNPTSEIPDQNAVTTPSSRLGNESMSQQQMNSESLVKETFVLADSMNTDGESASENDKGQMLQSTQLVLNILEVSMPGTFTPEQKKQVLTAVSQGTTVLNALQDAVPEDARENLTATVSEILSTGRTLKLDGFFNRFHNSGTLSDPKLAVLGAGVEKSDLDGSSSQNSVNGDVYLQKNKSDSTVLGSKKHNEVNDVSRHVDHIGDTIPEGAVDSMNGITEISVKDQVAYLDHNSAPAYYDLEEKVNVSGDEASSRDSALGDKGPIVDQSQGNVINGTTQLASEEESNTQNVEEKEKGSSADPNKIEPPTETGQSITSSKSDRASDVREEAKDVSTQLAQDNRKPDLPNNTPPSINISEVFDALSGMDDSTQVAVNSVFGVIEGMITQLEENTHNEKEIKNRQDSDFEKSRHAFNIRPDIEEKGNNIIQQNSETNDYSGDSVEPNNKIVNKDVDKRIVQRSYQDEKAHHVINNSSGFHEKGINIVHQNDVIKGSSNSAGDSRESHHKITNENVDESTVQQSPQGDNGQNWPAGPCFGTNEKDNDQATVDGFAGLENVTEIDVQLENKIIDPELPKKHVDNRHVEIDIHESDDTESDNLHNLDELVKRIITDSIEAKILSRLSSTNMKEISRNLAKDLELVSNAITQAVREDNIAAWSTTGSYLDNGSSLEICADHIAKAVSFTVPKTSYLRRDLPTDAIVGLSLAALKKHLNVIIRHDHDKGSHGETKGNSRLCPSVSVNDNVNEMILVQASENHMMDVLESSHTEKKDSVIVGAVTAAVGASALLMQDSYMNGVNNETLAKSLKKKEYRYTEPDMSMVEIPETQNNLVSSIADKAMSVAGPVVPMKENGAVDQERLVSMLANLGQNGGILKLVGKAALLWGGVRGAMSLTQKLILFLHLSERPLFQRLLGFGGMVILLWSPVYVPLLPTIVRGWATKSTSKSAELSCIVGLYVAVTVLIALWGKRIRGYERPLKQYGLDFSLHMCKTFMMTYVGGALIVFSIQYINTMIGFASSVSLETCILSASSTWLPEFGKFLLLVAQGTISATGAALVEELLFRSWLPSEVSEEFGFHVGIVMAGFTFSVFQRCLGAIPGLWLLSLALAGAKERSQGSLWAPVGLRAGMLTTTYVLQKIGFLTYHATVPFWFMPTNPIQPVSGITGLAFSLLLAVYLYPRQPYTGIKSSRKIRE